MASGGAERGRGRVRAPSGQGPARDARGDGRRETEDSRSTFGGGSGKLAQLPPPASPAWPGTRFPPRAKSSSTTSPTGSRTSTRRASPSSRSASFSPPGASSTPRLAPAPRSLRSGPPTGASCCARATSRSSPRSPPRPSDASFRPGSTATWGFTSSPSGRPTRRRSRRASKRSGFRSARSWRSGAKWRPRAARPRRSASRSAGPSSARWPRGGSSSSPTTRPSICGRRAISGTPTRRKTWPRSGSWWRTSTRPPPATRPTSISPPTGSSRAPRPSACRAAACHSSRPKAFRGHLPGAEVPTLPFIAGYGLTAGNPGRARELAEQTPGVVVHDSLPRSSTAEPDRFAAELPGTAGATLLFSRSGVLNPAG